MTNKFYPALTMADFYKISHSDLYPEGTEFIYSTWTPRSNKYMPSADKVVAYRFQAFVKEILIDFFNDNFFNKPLETVIEEYVAVIKNTLLVDEPKTEHIEKLWKKRYLPIAIRSIEEGTLVPIKTPLLTIENTDKEFYWLTGFLETILSTSLWKPMTVATLSLQYRKLLEKASMETTGNIENVPFQLHDFSMRGMSGIDDAAATGTGHLLNFVGTDSIPAIMDAHHYYNAPLNSSELIGTSIVATEHSIMSLLTPANSDRNEYHAYKYLLDKNPTGFLSVVSDTYNIWKITDEILPGLKEQIMNRDGRLVIRPDSGDPVEILMGVSFKEVSDINNINIQGKFDNEGNCTGTEYYKSNGIEYRVNYNGVKNGDEVKYHTFVKELNSDNKTTQEKGIVEKLWEIFGGEVNELGYKVLDTHIGTIYGDSITLERAEQIVERLKEKGFASTNVVMGVGSYSYNYLTRDSLGFAMKATWAQINNEYVKLLKDPITDDGTKKSLTGKVFVYKDEKTNEIVTIDNLNAFTPMLMDGKGVIRNNLMKTLFINGELKRETTFKEVRNRITEGMNE